VNDGRFSDDHRAPANQRPRSSSPSGPVQQNSGIIIRYISLLHPCHSREFKLTRKDSSKKKNNANAPFQPCQGPRNHLLLIGNRKLLVGVLLVLVADGVGDHVVLGLLGGALVGLVARAEELLLDVVDSYH